MGIKKKNPGLTTWAFIFWCPLAELNHGHRDFQSLALPTELKGHKIGLDLTVKKIMDGRSFVNHILLSVALQFLIDEHFEIIECARALNRSAINKKCRN